MLFGVQLSNRTYTPSARRELRASRSTVAEQVVATRQNPDSHLTEGKREAMNSISAVLRGSNVYFTALRVAWNIKQTQWKDKQLRIQYGIPIDDEFESHPSIDNLWEKTHETNAAIVTQAIVDLKGLWIKVGQFLSSRPDIMPMSYVKSFKRLQDSLPSRPWTEVERTIINAFGKEYEHQYFSKILKEPISCASIAQVHRATLKSGEEVVLKIRHHNVERSMRNDLKNLETLCSWIAWWEPKYDFCKIVAEWIPAVEEEIDFRNEARNLKEIRDNMAEANVNVIIPRIVKEELVKPSILVMEYCKGFSVRETSLFDTYKVDKMKVLERICNAWAVQMHMNGVFNADPHPGNILISTDEHVNDGDSSIPILLDFGLTRRFSDDIRIAFARLVHSCHIMDVDGLLTSFDEMGLVVQDKDPFQDIFNLRSYFQTVPASMAKSEREQRLKQYKLKEQSNPRTRRPVDAWPGELVFFTRVLGLLKGLCSMLETRYPYLQKTAAVAEKVLLNAYAQEHHAKGLFYPESKASGDLQNRIKSHLMKLDDKKELLGAQVAAIHKGEYIVDIAAGKLGSIDPRPVRPDTLFNVFSVTKGLTALLLHIVIQKTNVSYDDLVSTYWSGFNTNGKESCTIRHVLNHQAGLADAFLQNATIEQLLDWHSNLNFLQDSEPAHLPGEKEHYHYLTFGYLVGGILENLTGKHFQSLLQEWIVCPLSLNGELYVGLPKDMSAERLAVLQNGFIKNNEDGMMQSFGSDQSSNSTAPKWEKFKGREHLYNPTTFNMRQVREACMPSANGHMSAQAIAKFYSILAPSSFVSLVNAKTIVDSFDEEAVERITTNDVFLVSAGDTTYGLGFRIYKFLRLVDGAIIYGLGHPGMGGSFGMAIPAEDFSVGITTSHLKQDGSLRNQIIKDICLFLGLEPLNSFNIP